MYSVDESLTPNDYTHLKITSGLSNFRGRIKMTANNSTSSGLASLTSGCWRLQWVMEVTSCGELERQTPEGGSGHPLGDLCAKLRHWPKPGSQGEQVKPTWHGYTQVHKTLQRPCGLVNGWNVDYVWYNIMWDKEVSGRNPRHLGTHKHTHIYLTYIYMYTH